MLWQTAPMTWSLTQRDVVLSIIMVVILFVGMYILFRLMVIARHTEPILSDENHESS